MGVRGHTLAADWFRNGDYTGTYDDVTSNIDGDDIVISWGRDQATAAVSASAGKIGFALLNLTRRYSPENTASPLYGKVTPGTPIRYQVEADDTIHTLFGGILETVGADPTGGADPVTCEALDGWGLLSGTSLSTPVYAGIRTGDAVTVILDEIGWTGGRDIDPGVSVMPWWWAEDTTAAEAVDRLLRTEGPPAAAYVEAGVFVFRDRHHRVLRAVSATSQGTYTHIEPAGSGPAGDYKIERGSFRYDHGLTSIANSVTFAVEQRQPSDVATVWTSEDPLTVAAGQTVQVVAQAEDPFVSALTPEADVDYTVASGAVTVAISRGSGRSVTLSVTASSDAVVTRLAVRATPIVVARTVKVVYEDTASISQFGRRAWTEDCGLANVYDAAVCAQKIITLYGMNRPTITVRIAHVHGGPIPARYLDQILRRRIGDRITVRHDPTGINADFYIEKIAHTIRKLGAIHRMELVCSAVEPDQPASVFTFDAAGLGFDDGLFGLDGLDNPDTMLVFDDASQGFDDGVFAN